MCFPCVVVLISERVGKCSVFSVGQSLKYLKSNTVFSPRTLLLTKTWTFALEEQMLKTFSSNNHRETFCLTTKSLVVISFQGFFCLTEPDLNTPRNIPCMYWTGLSMLPFVMVCYVLGARNCSQKHCTFLTMVLNLYSCIWTCTHVHMQTHKYLKCMLSWSSTRLIVVLSFNLIEVSYRTFWCVWYIYTFVWVTWACVQARNRSWVSCLPQLPSTCFLSHGLSLNLEFTD